MLILKPGCECCDTDLPPAADNAWICSFECTYCTTCKDEYLKGVCPNCGGNLTKRPIRPAEKLTKFPASTERVYQESLLENLKTESLQSN